MELGSCHPFGTISRRFLNFLENDSTSFVVLVHAVFCHVLWCACIKNTNPQFHNRKSYIYIYIYIYAVDLRKSNGLILEQLETRTKNSRKIRFETRIKIRKSNHKRGIAQHRAAHAAVSQQTRTQLAECCWPVCTSARPVLP
jgi:hypothetical protein